MLDWLHVTQLGRETQALVLVLVLILGALLIRMSLKKLERFVGETPTEFDDIVLDFVKKFYRIVLFFVAVIGVLAIYDVDISPLLAGAGVVGLVLGLALKENLANVFAGISILIDRPFSEGDRIQLKKPSGHWGGWGDVKSIGLRRTKVENSDGIIVNYPNADLAQSTIINFSDKNDEEQPVRVRIRFNVDWSADLDLAVEVARAAICVGVEAAREKGFAVSKISDALPVPMADGTIKSKNTNPAVLVRSIWDDSLGFITPGVLLEGRYFLSNVRDRTKVRSIVLKEVLKALLREGVPMPNPTQVIHNPHPDS